MKIASRINLCLAFLVIGGAPALAGPNLELSAEEKALPLPLLYRAETEKVLRFLQEFGVEKIGCRAGARDCLSPADLQRALAGVKFASVEKFERAGPGTRWTAFYDLSQKQILLNENGYHDSNLAGFLGLHELFGVIGRPEREYQLTLLAFLYLSHVNWRERAEGAATKALIGARLEKLRLALARDHSAGHSGNSVSAANEQLYARLGGGTLIGGGGDAKGLLARIFFLHFAFNEMFTSGDLFIDKITAVPIELAPVPGARIAYFGFAARDPDPADLILVPSNLVGEDAKPMILEIAWFYASLMPEETALKKFLKPLPCHGSALLVPADEAEFHPSALALYWRPLIARRCSSGGQK